MYCGRKLKHCTNEFIKTLPEQSWLGPTEVAGDGLGFRGIHKPEYQRIPWNPKPVGFAEIPSRALRGCDVRGKSWCVLCLLFSYIRDTGNKRNEILSLWHWLRSQHLTVKPSEPCILLTDVLYSQQCPNCSLSKQPVEKPHTYTSTICTSTALSAGNAHRKKPWKGLSKHLDLQNTAANKELHRAIHLSYPSN